MGPRTYIRGNRRDDLDPDLVGVASMGPRTYIRGNGLAVTRCAATPRKPVCERHSQMRIFPFLQTICNMAFLTQVTVNREHRVAAVDIASPNRSHPQNVKDRFYVKTTAFRNIASPLPPMSPRTQRITAVIPRCRS